MNRVYFSHSIRGKWGTACSMEQMDINCKAAFEMAEKVRAACPWLDLYLPAEHEDFVHTAFEADYITEEQILDVDCKILDRCDLGTIIFIPKGDELQGGRLIEHDHAINSCLPVCLFATAKEAIDHLTELYNYRGGATSTTFGGNA